MRATKPDGQRARRPSIRPPGEPGRLLVRLVTRLVVAQTIAAAAVGLPFSRRQLSDAANRPLKIEAPSALLAM